MASILDQLKADPIWDSRYDLPTCPTLNNPWIYMSYADLVCGGSIDRDDVENYFDACEHLTAHIGLINRWPDGSGGNMSQDELIGVAYFEPMLANDVFQYVEWTDGEYNNRNEPETYPMQFNVYRFPWFRPYLLAAAGRPVNLIDQAIWSAMLILDSFSSDEGGHLRCWVMTQHMKRLPICNIVILFWKWNLERKGITPKTCLAVEPKEYPILSRLAPEVWT